MDFLRLLARVFRVGATWGIHALVWWVGWASLLASFRGKAARQRWQGQRLCALFRSLGPTYVKIGQIISTRPDLFPVHIIKALETLQDNVGSFPFSEVVSEFDASPESLFRSFDASPIASASIAQVHEATLQDGTRVAVKVRRPGIERVIALDMRILRTFAKFIQILPTMHIYAPVASIDEFGNAISAQVDLSIEASNNQRFQVNFADDPSIVIPKVIESLSTHRILTMEFVSGVKILRYREVDANPTLLAKIGFHTLLKMIFEDGFVHADLHPGNLFVTPEGKVALIDFGLVARLDDKHRNLFAEFFAAWAASDGVNMARLMVAFSPQAQVQDYDKYQEDICTFVKRYDGKTLGEVAVSKVVYDMMGIMRRHRVRVNPVFTMVNLSIAVTEGIGRQLDDTLDLLSETLPFFIELKQRGVL